MKDCLPGRFTGTVVSSFWTVTPLRWSPRTRSFSGSNRSSFVFLPVGVHGLILLFEGAGLAEAFEERALSVLVGNRPGQRMQALERAAKPLVGLTRSRIEGLAVELTEGQRNAVIADERENEQRGRIRMRTLPVAHSVVAAPEGIDDVFSNRS